MNIEEVINNLEAEWDMNGFLHELRQGKFNKERAEHFLQLLTTIEFDESETVPSRFVALIWYLYPFLEWQTARVSGSIDANEYSLFINKVTAILEEVIGIP